nr:EAL domain-containing protein [Gammaproteobacteria bacterium]
MESAEERVTLHSNSTSKMREGAWTEQLKLLAQEAHGSVVYGAGTRIFEEADVGKTAFFIEEGYVELSKLVNGKKTRVATIGPGEIFGEMATLDGHARSASAVALHDTVLIPFTRAQLDAIVQSEHPLFQVLLRTALERLRTVQEENSPCDAPTAPPPKSINWAQRQVTEHIKLRVALERAITKSELELLYQPIVQLRDGTVAGFEALVRWPGAPEGYSGPAQFIPFAERTGLILPMGEWILQTALRGMQRLNGGKSTWRKQQRAVFMSVNISPEQIASSDNLERLISIIKDGDADPSQLKLEITEGTMLNDTEMALESLSRLRGTG